MLTTVHSILFTLCQILFSFIVNQLSKIFLIENNFDYAISDDQDNTELDVFVPDVEYLDGNHPSKNGIWEDPDVQLCNHYGIDYELVNCIEAM